MPFSKNTQTATLWSAAAPSENTSEAVIHPLPCRMSFMIETPYAKEKMTAKENLEKQRIQKGIPDKGRIDEVLEIVGLSDYPYNTAPDLHHSREVLSESHRPHIMLLISPSRPLTAQLCTDYLFIHHGRLIQALSAGELQRQCKEYYHVHTDNDAMALAVLQERNNQTCQKSVYNQVISLNLIILCFYYIPHPAHLPYPYNTAPDLHHSREVLSESRFWPPESVAGTVWIRLSIMRLWQGIPEKR